MILDSFYIPDSCTQQSTRTIDFRNLRLEIIHVHVNESMDRLFEIAQTSSAHPASSKVFIDLRSTIFR